MILQLNPSIPVYIPKFEAEGYAFALESSSIQNYLIFHIFMDKSGEVWSLPQTDVRACINYSAGRSSINKESKSVYIDKLKKDGNIKPE